MLPLALFLLPLLVCTVAAPATPSLNLGIIRAHKALVQARATHIPPAETLQSAVAPLQDARMRDPDNVYIYSHLGSVYTWLGDYPAALAAFDMEVALEGQGPMDRHAPFEALRRRIAGETEHDPWDDLLWVYQQWQTRYPHRAEGYLRLAIVWDQHRDNPARARSFLQAGIEAGAEPAGLLAYYLAQLDNIP